jgi:mevalonate kinase
MGTDRIGCFLPLTSATAPGKIILFGEHAVVYGRPALAIPVMQLGVTVEIESRTETSITSKPVNLNWQERITISAPEIGHFGTLASFASTNDRDPLALTVEKVFNTLGITDPPVMSIQIASSLPVASGLGSGAAVSVALIRALAASLGRSISDEKVNQIAFEIEKVHHGTPSGIDNTVITYAQPVYYVKNMPLETFSAGTPFTLVIADTGIKAETRESVGDVRKLWQAEPDRMEKIFSAIAHVVDQARHAIQSGELAVLGNLMDQNQALLHEMTVSSPELDHRIATALSSGAMGAKLSGGGRGGNMIALVQPETSQMVANALRDTGATGTIITQVS